jgi:hypothetical protein
MLGQKPTPARSIAGRTRNIGSDGSMYQKVDCVRLATRSVSPVSRQSQRIANTDTKGNETISAPKAGLRFATSDTTAMIMPDNAHLMMKY